MKFRGDFAKLKKCVDRTAIPGEWRDLESREKQFRSNDGGVLNWWESSGTILLQGQKQPKRLLEQRFVSVAQAKGRIVDAAIDKDAGSLKEDNAILRGLIADVLLENAKLRRRASRST